MRSVDKGLYTDSELINQPNGFPCDALNANFDKKDNTVCNEEGFSVHISSVKIGDAVTQQAYLPDNTYIVGHGKIDATRTVLMLYSSLGNHNIGIYHNNGTYEAKIRDFNLNFQANRTIHVTTKIKNGDVIVAFCDGYNPDRILNLDTLPFPSGIDTSTLGLIDGTEMHLCNKSPDHSGNYLVPSKVLSAGGMLSSGAYRYFFWYETRDGVKLPYSEATEVVIINDKSEAVDWKDYDGCNPGKVTTKAVEITFIGTGGYDYINIGVIQTINNVTSIYKIARIHKVTGGTYLHTGFEDKETIAVEDYYVNKASYVNSKVVFNTNDGKLGFANMTGHTDVGYQKYANNITVTLCTKQVSHHRLSLNSNGIRNNLFVALNKTFQPSEVIAIYIGFLLTDGTESYAYHIPGRAVSTCPDAGGASENATVSSLKTVFSALEADDAISPGEVKLFHTRDTGHYHTTGMGYWENEDELYPDADLDTKGDFEIWEEDPLDPGTGRSTGLTLHGQKVRHHKFRSMRGFGGNATEWYDNSSFSPLTSIIYGINVSNIFIPDDIRSQIKGISIYVAERTQQNQTVIGNGLLFHDQPSSNVFSTQCFDLMVNGNGQLASYITNEFFMRLLDEEDNMYVTTANKKNRRALMYDKPSPAGMEAVVPVGLSHYYVRGIYDHHYDSDIVAEDLTGATAYQAARFIGSIRNLGASTPPLFTATGVLGHVGFYLSNFCVFRKNVYQSFDLQPLVKVAYTNDTSVTSINNIYQGDVFTCDYAFRLITVKDDMGANITSATTNQGLPRNSRRLMYFHPCLCTNNANFRYEDEFDLTDNRRYYPQDHNGDFGWTYLKRDITNKVNTYVYDPSYNAKNIAKATTYEYISRNISRFPLRITLSETSNEEELADSWREFLPNNYFDLSRRQGEITNIISFGDEILINTTRNLFRTIGSKQLKIEQVTTYIGSGDIFSLTPQEQTLPDNGYAGCTSKYSCIKVHTGYIYVNQDHGKIFLYDGKLKEISSIGMKNWFEHNLPSELKKQTYNAYDYDFIFDNPVKGIGVHCGYDKHYERLIVTKIDYKPKYTYAGPISLHLESAGRPEGIYFIDIDSYIYPLGSFAYWNDLSLISIELTDTDYFTDISWTMTYSLKKNQWRSWHSYKGNIMFDNDYELFMAITPDILYRQEIRNTNIENKYGKYFSNTPNEFFIEYVINIGEDYQTGQGVNVLDNKLFEAFEWITEAYNSNKHNEYDKTFTKVLIYNENQCSGILTLTTSDLKEVDGTWRFNNFRDMVSSYTNKVINEGKGIITADKVIAGTISSTKPWYKQYYINGKYIVIRMMYNNIDQNEIYLHGYEGKFRKSFK